MKIIIAGSRNITNYEILPQVLRYSKFHGTEVVSGGARGVDAMGEELAKAWNWKLTIFPAEWEKYGKRAGILRNIQMGDYADALVAIWDGESKGTKHMIEYMQSLNKPVFVYTIPR